MYLKKTFGGPLPPGLTMAPSMLGMNQLNSIEYKPIN